jgi:hypothetical protein
MKSQADKWRTERHFEVGDMVFLKLQPYIQLSLAPRANQKFTFKFFGPFKIISKVGSVAYKLQLPESSSIHLVFHVLQLKKAIPPSVGVAQLPFGHSGFQVPKKILQRRMASEGTAGFSQVLV